MVGPEQRRIASARTVAAMGFAVARVDLNAAVSIYFPDKSVTTPADSRAVDGKASTPEPSKTLREVPPSRAVDRGGMAESTAPSPRSGRFSAPVRHQAHPPGEAASSKEFVEMFINEARISALLDTEHRRSTTSVRSRGLLPRDGVPAGRNLLASRPPPAQPRRRDADRSQRLRGAKRRAASTTRIPSPIRQTPRHRHRDVTRQHMHAPTGGVKLLDFGIARATMKLHRSRRSAAWSRGSSPISHPSRCGARASTPGPTCSPWGSSCGMPDGLRLFYDPNDLETMRNVLHRPIPNPSEVRRGLPAALRHPLRDAQRDLDGATPMPPSWRPSSRVSARAPIFTESAVKLLAELFAGARFGPRAPLSGTPRS